MDEDVCFDCRVEALLRTLVVVSPAVKDTLWYFANLGEVSEALHEALELERTIADVTITQFYGTCEFPHVAS